MWPASIPEVSAIKINAYNCFNIYAPNSLLLIFFLSKKPTLLTMNPSTGATLGRLYLITLISPPRQAGLPFIFAQI
jgi:hypothetical protein